MATFGSVLLAALCACTCLCALGVPLMELDYGRGRDLSLELNQLARSLSTEVKTLKQEVVVTEPPLMIRTEDRCDPESLQQNPQTCLARVVLALKNYSRIFGDGGMFEEPNTDCHSWRMNATEVAKVIEQFLSALREPSEAPEPLMMDSWMAEGLCRDSVKRLYSFSIITARVFNYLHSLQPESPSRSG